MRICAFTHCHNGDYRLKKWEDKMCKKHLCHRFEDNCSCPKPYKLFPFPLLSQGVERAEWTRLVYRKDVSTGKNWQPSADDRICSVHFHDGKPSKEYPYPCLNLPQTAPNLSRKRRASPKSRSTLQPKKRHCIQSVASADTERNALEDHTDCIRTCTCTGECLHESLRDVTQLYVELKDSSSQNRKIQTTTTKKVDKTLAYLKTDKKVKMYTGLPNKNAFNDLLSHLGRKAAKLRYWKGGKSTTKLKRNFKKTPEKSGPKLKLTMKEELLIVLMKLRLGLLNAVLGDMFGASAASVSVIFNTWIKFLSKELRPMIFFPRKEIIQAMLPQQLRKYPNLRCTLDCTEIYIDRPRDLKLQALTWSDYKKHNTIKLLGIAPNGHISFLSSAWGGRASDQHIVRESGFLDLIDPGDTIMADRGFPIQEDLLLRGAALVIPPPSSGMEQMSRDNVLKTKMVANARIHVERAIGRMKWFSIMKNTLPISLVPIANDIFTVCAALCNLLPPLVN